MQLKEERKQVSKRDDKVTAYFWEIGDDQRV